MLSLGVARIVSENRSHLEDQGSGAEIAAANQLILLIFNTLSENDLQRMPRPALVIGRNCPHTGQEPQDLLRLSLHQRAVCPTFHIEAQ